jgi:hypothetical protein
MSMPAATGGVPSDYSEPPAATRRTTAAPSGASTRGGIDSATNPATNRGPARGACLLVGG